MTSNDPFSTSNAGAAPDPFDDDNFEADAGAGEEEELPPEGWYIAACIGIQNSVSKSSGNPMFVWEHRIVSDMNGDTKWAGFDPKPQYTVKSANAAWKLDQVCRAHGLKENDKGKFEFKRADVVNVLVAVELGEDEYNGRKQRVITNTHPHPSGAGKRHEGDDLLARPAGPPAAEADVPF